MTGSRDMIEAGPIAAASSRSHLEPIYSDKATRSKRRRLVHIEARAKQLVRRHMWADDFRVIYTKQAPTNHGYVLLQDQGCTTWSRVWGRLVEEPRGLADEPTFSPPHEMACTFICG